MKTHCEEKEDWAIASKLWESATLKEAGSRSGERVSHAREVTVELSLRSKLATRRTIVSVVRQRSAGTVG